MNFKMFNILSTTGIMVLFMSFCGCKENLELENENLKKPDEFSASSNPNLTTTVGSNTQDFYELKDANAENSRLLLGTPWSDFDPTGFYLPPNATMRIVVKQLAGSKRPKILVGTYSRYDVQYDPKVYSLTADTNTITANNNGGLVWIRFGTSGTPTSKVRITFLTGHVPVPVYIKNTTTALSWANQLATFTQSPDVILIGERVYQVYSRALALSYQPQDNDYVLGKADQTMEVEDAISGLDGSAPEHQPNIHPRVLMTESDRAGYMSATSYRTRYVGTDACKYAFTSVLGSEDGWGPWHELGHMHQQQPWKWDGLGEVTVNIYSLAVERAMGVTPSRLKRDNVWPLVATFLADTSSTKNFNDNAFIPSKREWVRLSMFHQLWMAFGDNFYKNLHKETRTLRPNLITDQDKMRYFMLKSCTISGKNLTVFFKKWGFLVNQSVYTEISDLNLPQPSIEPSTLSEQ